MAVCVPLFSFAHPNEHLMKFKTSRQLLTAGLLTISPELRAHEQHPKELNLDTPSREKRISAPIGSDSFYSEAARSGRNQLTVKRREEFFILQVLGSLVAFA